MTTDPQQITLPEEKNSKEVVELLKDIKWLIIGWNVSLAVGLLVIIGLLRNIADSL